MSIGIRIKSSGCTYKTYKYILFAIKHVSFLTQDVKNQVNYIDEERYLVKLLQNQCGYFSA